MLHLSGMVLDKPAPLGTGAFVKNIRIAVLKTPLVDEMWVLRLSGSSIPSAWARKILSGAAQPRGEDGLSRRVLRYGVSICVAGATGSGKTTVADGF
jgi:pilus assembly protein CpaF